MKRSKPMSRVTNLVENVPSSENVDWEAIRTVTKIVLRNALD